MSGWDDGLKTQSGSSKVRLIFPLHINRCSLPRFEGEGLDRTPAIWYVDLN